MKEPASPLLLAAIALILGACTAPDARSMRWDGLDTQRLNPPAAPKSPNAPAEVDK